MRYALLIHDLPDGKELTDEESAAITAEYMAIRKSPLFRDGARLDGPETASTVRVQDGETLVTDGPFADTKEVFAGYYLIEADDLDDAIALAARIPAARHGGAIEVRPLMDLRR
jgi:hypothetical protein